MNKQLKFPKIEPVKWDFEYNPKTLSAHEQLKCKAFISDIEEVERKHGMRIPERKVPVIQKYDPDFERRVDDKGIIYPFDLKSE